MLNIPKKNIPKHAANDSVIYYLIYSFVLFEKADGKPDRDWTDHLHVINGV
jgi:hypothetical protein